MIVTAVELDVRGMLLLLLFPMMLVTVVVWVVALVFETATAAQPSLIR